MIFVKVAGRLSIRMSEFPEIVSTGFPYRSEAVSNKLRIPFKESIPDSLSGMEYSQIKSLAKFCLVSWTVSLGKKLPG